MQNDIIICTVFRVKKTSRYFMPYKVLESLLKHTTKGLERPGKAPEMFCTNSGGGHLLIY